MKSFTHIVLLGLCLTGCVTLGASVEGGYTKGFGTHARDATRLSAHLGILRKPQKTLNLPGPGQTWVIDRDATCFYGYGGSLHGSFNKDLAMLGMGIDWFGYCKANKIVSFTADIGAKVFEIGHSGGFSVGFTSPLAELGIRFRVLDGLFIEGYGLGGLDIRVGKQETFGYAGGGLRITVGDLP